MFFYLAAFAITHGRRHCALWKDWIYDANHFCNVDWALQWGAPQKYIDRISIRTAWHSRASGRVLYREALTPLEEREGSFSSYYKVDMIFKSDRFCSNAERMDSAFLVRKSHGKRCKICSACDNVFIFRENVDQMGCFAEKYKSF